jgi:hypothetical protein
MWNLDETSPDSTSPTPIFKGPQKLFYVRRENGHLLFRQWNTPAMKRGFKHIQEALAGNTHPALIMQKAPGHVAILPVTQERNQAFIARGGQRHFVDEHQVVAEKTWVEPGEQSRKRPGAHMQGLPKNESGELLRGALVHAAISCPEIKFWLSHGRCVVARY